MAAQRDARESEWDLKEEAMYVFKLADKNGSGDLDETEVEAVRSSSAVLRMQLTEIDTDGNGVIDEGEWLVYIKAQSVANSAATKKLLRAFAKQCGAELDFDAMKRAEAEQAEQRELAEAERRLREEKRKVDSEARQSLQDRTSGADPGAA